jgi:hypothetical protein
VILADHRQIDDANAGGAPVEVVRAKQGQPIRGLQGNIEIERGRRFLADRTDGLGFRRHEFL